MTSTNADIVESDGVTVFRLATSYESLPDDSLAKLSEQLLTCVHEQAAPLLVLDFSRTEFINSSFIEIVFRAWKRAKEKHGQMAICCLKPFCAEVLKVTKLDKVWTICDSREAALEAVRNQAT